MLKKSMSVLLVIIMLFGVFNILMLSTYAQETDISEEAAEPEIAAVGGDDYPYSGGAIDAVDRWQLYTRECTSFCAWRLNNNNGVAFTNWYGGVRWGDAGNWGYAAQSIGITVDMNPAPGSIAWWSSGHVAWVSGVNGDNVDIEEYNCPAYSYNYNARTINRYSVSGYIHIKDLPQGNNPTSYLDSITGGVGVVNVTGWTFDKDDLTKPLYIHVYVGGSSANSGAEGSSIYADTPRVDVDNVYHVGAFHGFDVTIPTSKSGYQEVYVYAINIGGGENTEIGHKTVYISPDTEKPTLDDLYLSLVTNDSYRVCVLPKDNVAVKKVRVATWTQSDQSDLIWHDASFNGTLTYYVDIKRSDYSAIKNSYYYNHVYVYDYADNFISVACDKNYRITSDTGQSVPEGEYRIVTAVNENRAISVENDSKDSGANIFLWNNLSNPNQTFNLKYLNNGFYTIANSNSNHLLDVEGDTYINNTNVIQCTANGGTNQEWMIKPSGDGYYYIIAHNNGLALDVTNALDQNGANVAVHTQNQSTAQKWMLRRVLKPEMIQIDKGFWENGIYEPNVIVTADSKTLNKDVDYTVEAYAENNKLYVKVTGIGSYCDSVSAEYTEQPKCILGDADGDGEITPLDVTYIQRYCVLLETNVNENNLKNADVDGNGFLEVIDATFIQRYIAKMDIPYNIG